MKKKFLVAFAILLALFLVYRFGKGSFISWYVDSYFIRDTPFPAGEAPDQLCLTWSNDPATSQAIQWRTAPGVDDGWVEYRQQSAPDGAVQAIEAQDVAIEDANVRNDPTNKRFTAELSSLEPGTTYAYRTGSREMDTWSTWRSFTTAPASVEPFSFIYLGDVHIGKAPWGRLLTQATRNHPGTAFYVIAGDLVNKGTYRDQWDIFWASSYGFFSRRPLVPALGNHDYGRADAPDTYLAMFALPENGPDDLQPGRVYSFTYSNAFYVVLDSNLPPETQTAWLEQQLAGTSATWKFAIYHHPAFSSKASRDNPEVREIWGPIFDKYHVDMAFQGHDHAYLRTYPMRAGKRVDSAADGTYYIIAVSGTRLYDQEPQDYAEVAFQDIVTYQTIDIATNPNRLTYAAWDGEGVEKDRLVIEK